MHAYSDISNGNNLEQIVLHNMQKKRYTALVPSASPTHLHVIIAIIKGTTYVKPPVISNIITTSVTNKTKKQKNKKKKKSQKNKIKIKVTITTKRI